MKRLVLLGLLVCAGCSRVPNSAIVAKFEAAGGGNASVADVADITRWLWNHQSVRGELQPLCDAKRSSAPADWPNSDEGKLCQAVVNAQRVVQRSDGVRF